MKHKAKRKNSSSRYCFICNRITTFNLKRNLGHSACCKCGSRFGIPESKIGDELKRLGYTPKVVYFSQ